MFKPGDQINTSVDGVAVSGTVTECDLGMVNFTLNAPAYNFCVDEASCTMAKVTSPAIAALKQNIGAIVDNAFPKPE